ncbi:hypothetical protein KC338_g5401 [Hortaea werneckii]|nr:hypothetical protein KC338_g5401 [Hortaea werneckii]
MYIDSKPVSLYARTQDWKMPSPQPRDSSSVKRPPILKNGSSSSSLRGMEQSVPSFQTFIKRTPPPDHLKPLPPTPLRPHQRASSFDSGISQCPSSSGRRSSSVYSRTVSQWDPEWDSQPEEVPEVPPLPDWRSADFADQDTNLLLRPIAYSASTSQLLEKTPQQDQQPISQPQLLEPRAYRPLIVTPSPTASASPSRATTPSPRPSSDSRPSILLPPPPASAQVPKKHLRTVSLEKAQELIQAPGAVHLLPEELRAQQTLTRKTTRSQEPMRMVSREGFDAGTVPSLEFPTSLPSPVLPTLIDEYGRERLLASPRESRVPLFSYEMPSPPLPPPAGEWKATGFAFRAPERFKGGHGRAVSREKFVQTPRFDQTDEDRGRARIRGSRTLSYGNYIPSSGRERESRIGEGEEYEDQLAKDEALRIAQDYHFLLREEQQERYRQPSSSPAASRGSETDDVRVQMKMVPQPLFHAKPWSGTHLRRESADNDFSSRSSVQSKSERISPSPFHLRSGSGASLSSSRGSSDGHGSFPLRLSTTPPPRPSRGSSTSGTTPISPPFATALPKKMSVVSAKALPLAKKKMKKERAGRTRADDGGEDRVSMYYPHVMSRRTKKEGGKRKGGGKEKKKKGKEAKQEEVSPGVPLLAADIVAQRLETPETTPEASLRSDSASGRSAVVEEKPTLHQLVLKGAARYAEKLTGSGKQTAGPASSSASTAFPKPQQQYTHDEPSADHHRFASPDSPHLLPSPSSGGGKPPPIHLGWSSQSKTSFDRIRSPTAQQSPKHRQRSKDLPAAAQAITHIQTPARPMNERIAGLKEESSASEAGGGIGGNSGTKPAGILGGLMESWRESKAEKRREDLRKMIRVVTPAGVEGGGRDGGDRGLQELRRGCVGAGAGGGRQDGVQRPAGQMQRRLSAFNWM